MPYSASDASTPHPSFSVGFIIPVISMVFVLGACGMHNEVYSDPAHDPALICPSAVRDEPLFGCDPRKLRSNYNLMTSGLPSSEQMISYFTPMINKLKTEIQKLNPHATWETYDPVVARRVRFTDPLILVQPQYQPRVGCPMYADFEDENYRDSDAEMVTFPQWVTENLPDDQFQRFFHQAVEIARSYGVEGSQDFGKYIKPGVVMAVFNLYDKVAETILNIDRSAYGQVGDNTIEISLETSCYLPQRYWTIPLPAAPVPGHYPDGYVAYPNGIPAPTITPTSSTSTSASARRTPPTLDPAIQNLGLTIPDDTPPDAILRF